MAQAGNPVPLLTGWKLADTVGVTDTVSVREGDGDVECVGVAVTDGVGDGVGAVDTDKLAPQGHHRCRRYVQLVRQL